MILSGRVLLKVEKDGGLVDVMINRSNIFQKIKNADHQSVMMEGCGDKII